MKSHLNFFGPIFFVSVYCSLLIWRKLANKRDGSPKWKFLPLTELGFSLSAKYRIPLMVNVLCFIAFSLFFSWFLIFWLGHVLGIDMHAPANTQPHDRFFGILMMTTFISSLIFFYFFSFVFMALVLRYKFNWEKGRIYKLIFNSEIPKHWLKNKEPNQALHPTPFGRG
jgi:hypothetical protein